MGEEISATVGRSAGIGAGIGLGVGALGAAAAGGNAVAQVAQPVVQAGMTVMAAESAGQNAGNAVGAAEAGNYRTAALYGTLALADSVSTVAGARGLAQQIAGSASVPTSVNPEGGAVAVGNEAHNAARFAQYKDGLRASEAASMKASASQSQMAETGRIMAGPGGRARFRDAERIAQECGGSPTDWVKKTSSSYTAPDGVRFETHWVENIKTGQRAEFKTKLQ